MATARIDRLCIHEEALAYDLTREVRARCAAVPVSIVREPPAPDPSNGRTLYLAVQPGRFLREFDAAGPDARHIVFQTGCFFACAYCYLRTYLDQPRLVTVYVNQDSLRQELAQLADERATLYTGELTDSLIVDDLTHTSAVLCSLCRAHPHYRMELRTKTGNIGHLLTLSAPPNLTVTWTLSPVEVSQAYEQGGPLLAARLAAMQQCLARGFKVGFHIDPIIRIKGWQTAYQGLIEKIFSAVRADDIQYVSIGALRFKKGLMDRSGIFLDEFVPGHDGKYRYFKPLRLDLYKTVIQLLMQHVSGEKVKICMEDSALQQNLYNIFKRQGL